MHHQGATEALRTLATLLAVAACVGCGGPSAPRSGPREGTLVFRQAPTSGGMLRSEQRTRGTTLIFTTSRELADDPAKDFAVQVHTGADRRPQFRAMTSRPQPKVLSPERFGALVAALSGAGLFDLPRFRGSQPPETTSYFSVELDGKTSVYVHPIDSGGDASEGDLQKWVSAKIALSQFANS